jgi:branched-subunit amino acid aminotransferase/4-amino-4-deoxychorismate lyase
VTRLRWTGDGFVSCADPGDVRIIDSFLVTDGKARAVDKHLRRFCLSCKSLYGVRADRFAGAAAMRIPLTGRWFPRLELAVASDGGEVQLGLWLRAAPAPGSAVRLWVPPTPDQRIRPRVKGPDLPYLAELRDSAHSAGADEAVLVSTDGYVLEGATTSLMWWRGNTLCVPPTELVLPSVTREVLLELAAARGIPLRSDLAAPGELRTVPVWAVNALHGVRTAVFS